MRERRLLIPEVVQTSAADCGPACLTALLGGFGRHVSYGRLREACQTTVDGTSIDAIEDLANRLGLRAEQIVLPGDHVCLPEAAALPAIAIVKAPTGFTHFVVIWRRHGNRLQVMDPAKGRCWISLDDFSKQLYEHEMAVPAEAWQEWGQSPEFTSSLTARMLQLGIAADEASSAIRMALADSTWRAIACLDAGVRMLQSFARAGALCEKEMLSRLWWRRVVDFLTQPPRAASKKPTNKARSNTEPFRILRAITNRALEARPENATQLIPEGYWSARPNKDGEVVVRGAILVRVKGRSAQGDLSALPREVAAAAAEAPAQPLTELWQLLKRDGALAPATIAIALFFSAIGVVLQAILFRALVQGGQEFSEKGQRLGAVIAVLALLLILLMIDIPTFGALVAMGRRLEVRFRSAFLEKLPRIAERYFHSRLTSDMAERSHSVHVLRTLPTLAGECLALVFELILTTAAIMWIDPHLWYLAILSAAVAIGLPLAAQPILGERELRVRTHAGALSRFYFDALLGLIPIRTHVADGVLRGEQRGLLAKWTDAGLETQGIAIGLECLQLFLGFGVAALMVVSHITRHPQSWATLLLVYWGLNMPMIGQQLVSLSSGYPVQRNVVLRLLEPLRALENRTDEFPRHAGPSHSHKPGSGVAIAMSGVGLAIGGRQLLHNINLKIRPGYHVAVVGSSGVGKSTLLGMVLGCSTPSVGTLRINDEPHTKIDFEFLRKQIGWIDPTVHLWQRSLIENLRYGTDGELSMPVGEALERAVLTPVLESLPEGLQTSLGDSGALLSGGEGERVRICRALLRPNVQLAVMDEPFRGLDATSRSSLLQTAREIWRNATMIFVTHDIAETQSFDQVVVMERGTIVESGAPRDLARNHSRYAEMLRSELEWKRELLEGERWRRLEMQHGTLLGTESKNERPEATISEIASNRELIA